MTDFGAKTNPELLKAGTMFQLFQLFNNVRNCSDVPVVPIVRRFYA
ncbi:hypothetical protein LCGC14_1460160 [marine sediment metagenome]|uniref:Uncharacterized protein n=1 Tax=marine sediment metagenome TaxID=412755 RepID=A0A0F9MHC3_9ZZZZ